MKERVGRNLYVGSTVEAEQAVGVALEDDNCTEGRGIKNSHQKGKNGINKLRNKNYTFTALCDKLLTEIPNEEMRHQLQNIQVAYYGAKNPYFQN